MSDSYPDDISALVSEHGPFLRGLARALVRNPCDADDLAQETWAAALTGPFGRIERPRAWLSMVLRRKVVSRARMEGARAVRATDPMESEAVSSALSPMDTVAQIERDQLLLRAMEALREPYRTAIYLRYREGIGAEEIAKRTGAPVKTVRTRLHRGLAGLRDQLDRLSGDRRTWLASLAPLAYLDGLKPGSASAVASVSMTSGTQAATAAFSMKNFIAAFAALLLVGAGTWWLIPDRDPVAPLDEPRPATEHGGAVAAASAKGSGPLVTDPEGEAESRRTAQAPPAAAPSMGAPVASMAQGGSVTITVKHADGSPAPGRSMVLGAWQNQGRLFVPRVLVTDAAGILRCEDLNSLGSYFVEDSLGGGSLPFNLATRSARDLVIVLDREIEVLGTVVDASGQPAPGAGIWSAPGVGDDEVSVRHAVAGPDGAFTLRCAPDSSLQAVLVGSMPSPMRGVSDLEEFESGRVRLTLTLRGEGASLQGLVVDQQDAPIAGAVVVAGPGGGRSMGDIEGSSPIPLHIWTDDEGRFRYPAGLPEGTWPVFVYAEGFASKRFELEFQGAPLGEQRIQLDGGVTVTGQVFLTSGVPAAKALLEYVAPGSSFSRQTYGRGRQTQAAADGTFELRNVPLGAGILRVQTPHNVPVERVLHSLDIATLSDQVVRIDLSDAPAIAGHVIDEDGQPMAGVAVRASSPSLMQRHQWGALTDAQGAFRLTSLEPLQAKVLRWDLAVKPRNQFFGDPLGTATNVAAGDTTVVIQARRPVPKTAFIEGRFEGPDGFIPANLDATIWRLGINMGLALDVDAESGAFRYGPVAPGTFSISAYIGDDRPYQKTGIVALAGETVDVGVLRSGAGGGVRITLQLSLPPETPMGELESLTRNASIVLRNSVGGEEWLGREGDVWASDTPIEPGTWRVEFVHAKILIARPLEVEVTDGETAVAALVADLGRKVTVKLTLPTEASWSELTVKAHWPDGAVAMESEPVVREDLTTQGRATVRMMVPLGSVRILVESDTDVGHDKVIEIPGYPSRFRTVELEVN